MLLTALPFFRVRRAIYPLSYSSLIMPDVWRLYQDHVCKFYIAPCLLVCDIISGKLHCCKQCRIGVIFRRLVLSHFDIETDNFIIVILNDFGQPGYLRRCINSKPTGIDYIRSDCCKQLIINLKNSFDVFCDCFRINGTDN